MNALDIAISAAQVADSKKALRIVLQDVKGLSDVCDYQLICSGTNEKQTQAICQGIEDYTRNNLKVKAYAVEGKQAGDWILLDYGAVVIHVFNDTLRDYYALDQLWPRAKPVSF